MDVLEWLNEQSDRLNKYADQKLTAAEKRLVDFELTEGSHPDVDPV